MYQTVHKCLGIPTVKTKSTKRVQILQETGIIIVHTFQQNGATEI